MQVDRARGEDHAWVCSKLQQLCAQLGAEARVLPGEGGVEVELAGEGELGGPTGPD
jgi:hypothetical protein